MRKIEPKILQEFELYLRNEERSEATIEKYMHDVRCFVGFIGSAEVNKQIVVDYKNKLGNSYAVASANSMIAALNSFLRFCGFHDLCIKQFRVQRQVYCSEEKELTRAEYIRLLEAHRKLFAEMVDVMTPIFKEKADVSSILHSVFTALFDFAIRVYNGELEDNEENRPHIFNVLYCMMITYFNN